jgi:hypothetical protein
MICRWLSRITFNFREINDYYMQEMSSEGKSISNITHSRHISSYMSRKILFFSRFTLSLHFLFVPLVSPLSPFSTDALPF